VVPILAADPVALKLVGDRLEKDGRAGDAEIVHFQRMLAQELWALFESAMVAAGPAGPVPAPGSRVWREELARQAKKRNELRSAYLTGPRKVLLELIKQHYLDLEQAGHPNLERARAALASLDFELDGMSKPRRDPLELVAQLADQRAHSVAEATAAEDRGIAAGDPAASRRRLIEMRQLAAGMRLLHSAALLSAEVELTSTHRDEIRKRWNAAIADAVGTQPNPAPSTLLERMLLLAGRRDSATPAELEAQYGGTGWAEALAALAELGALEGDAAGGYRASAELVSLWRAAGPRLRHAVRADARRAGLFGSSTLPGGKELVALAVPQLGEAGVTDAEQDAVAALRELLRNGDLAFRNWRDGWVDDAGITWRSLTGLGYRMRHPAGALNWPLPPAHPAAPIRFARGASDRIVARWQHRVVPGQQRRLLGSLLRRTDASDRLYYRALRGGEFLAGQRPGQSLLPEAANLLHAARAIEVQEYGRLAEARRRAAAALKAVGSYPHQVDRTLSATDAARPHAPGSDPLPPPAEHWLREITKELDAVRKRLDGLHPGPEWEAALAEARLSLERYAIDRDYAWASQLHRTMGGAKVMEKARVAAKKLRAAHPDLFRRPAAAAPGHSPVIPHRERVEHPYGDENLAEPGMAAATRRGMGNRTNQDAATLVTLPNGDRVAVVVDGVFSYPGSRLAAIEFATPFRTELARSDRAGRSPAQALRDAHQAGLDGLARRYAPQTGHGAVAYLAAYYGTDGTITTIHAGTARAYYLPLFPGRNGLQLTVDDSRGGDITDGGIMSRWAGSDYHPAPTVTTFGPNVPGLLVLATDGLWRYLPTAEALAAKLSGSAYLDPAEAARQLADAARTEGGRDDLTVAVLQAGALGRAGPRGLGGSGAGPGVPRPGRRGGAIAVTFPDAVPVALEERELAAAEQAVRELHHASPGAPLDAGSAEYRRADPKGRWAAHGVRVYVLPGLRRRFDQLTRPGGRELALLYFVTEDHAGVRAVFVDSVTLDGARKLSRSDRALIAERELVRIVSPELPEADVQAMPLPAPRQLRRLASRPYQLGVPEPASVPGAAAAGNGGFVEIRSFVRVARVAMAALRILGTAGVGVAVGGWLSTVLAALPGPVVIAVSGLVSIYAAVIHAIASETPGKGEIERWVAALDRRTTQHRRVAGWKRQVASVDPDVGRAAVAIARALGAPGGLGAMPRDMAAVLPGVAEGLVARAVAEAPFLFGAGGGIVLAHPGLAERENLERLHAVLRAAVVEARAGLGADRAEQLVRDLRAVADRLAAGAPAAELVEVLAETDAALGGPARWAPTAGAVVEYLDVLGIGRDGVGSVVASVLREQPLVWPRAASYWQGEAPSPAADVESAVAEAVAASPYQVVRFTDLAEALWVDESVLRQVVARSGDLRVSDDQVRVARAGTTPWWFGQGRLLPDADRAESGRRDAEMRWLRIWHPSLRRIPLADLAAAAAFVGDDSASAAMRGWDFAALERRKSTVLSMLYGMRQLPIWEGWVERGADFGDDAGLRRLLAAHQVGATFTTSQVLSASKSTAFHGEVQLRIYSRTGRNLELVSNKPQEKEVVFLPGTTFRVVAKTWNPLLRHWRIVLVEQKPG
jgi:serine/threonine protein phosphatase PrpC